MVRKVVRKVVRFRRNWWWKKYNEFALRRFFLDQKIFLEVNISTANRRTIMILKPHNNIHLRYPKWFVTCRYLHYFILWKHLKVRGHIFWKFSIINFFLVSKYYFIAFYRYANHIWSFSDFCHRFHTNKIFKIL